MKNKMLFNKFLCFGMSCLVASSSFMPGVSAKESVTNNTNTVVKKSSKKGGSAVKKLVKCAALAGASYGIYNYGKSQGRKEVIRNSSTSVVDFLYNFLDSKPKKWTRTRKYYFCRLVEGLARYNKDTTTAEEAERLARYLILVFFPKDEQQAVTIYNMVQIPNGILRHVCEDVTREVIDLNDKELAKKAAEQKAAQAEAEANRGMMDRLKGCCRSWLYSIFKYVAPSVAGNTVEAGVNAGCHIADWVLDFNDEDFLNNEGNIFGVKVATYKKAADKVTFGKYSEQIDSIPSFNVVNLATRDMVSSIANGVIPQLADCVKNYGEESYNKCYVKLANSSECNYFTDEFDEEFFAEGDAQSKWYHNLQFLNARGLGQFIYTIGIRMMAQGLFDKYQDYRS